MNIASAAAVSDCGLDGVALVLPAREDGDLRALASEDVHGGLSDSRCFHL